MGCKVGISIYVYGNIIIIAVGFFKPYAVKVVNRFKASVYADYVDIKSSVLFEKRLFFAFRQLGIFLFIFGDLFKNFVNGSLFRYFITGKIVCYFV